MISTSLSDLSNVGVGRLGTKRLEGDRRLMFAAIFRQKLCSKPFRPESQAAFWLLRPQDKLQVSQNSIKRRYSQFQQSTSRDRAAVGVFTPKAAALFVAVGVGLFFYFRHEKAKLLEARQKELETKSIGRAHVGGHFKLTTNTGKPFTELDLLGKWNLVYFGFTNCPDICPAELDKIGSIVSTLEKQHGEIFQPVFISVDPARDSTSQITRYLADFYPRFVGLVGDWDATKAVCKAYRVYFSTPPDANPNGDYLVDHSIFIYLMDPKGEFVEAFGQISTVDEVVERVQKEVQAWDDREA